MKYFLGIVLFTVAGAGNAFAHHESGGQQSGQAQTPAAGPKTGKGTGVLQQIDRERGAVTIKHGPLRELNMSAMTMTFLVRDKAMLSNLQPLQKVEFELTFDGRQFLITSIK